MRRVLALAVVLGAAAVAAPLLAIEKHVAIGDSITAASTWPFTNPPCAVCPIIFDCTAVCDDKPQADRDQCGHAKRLDDWLDTTDAPDNHYVKNRGWGGEQTDEAVVRFPTEMNKECPGSPGDCISVILMHGTNDMEGSVSPETARANLGLIVDEAKSRNLDVLLMTIIRRGGDPTNSKWKDYKDEILDLAADEDLQSVNPWQTLCPTTACFEDKYHWPGEGPCFDPNAQPTVGHLDPDGYDDLTDLIKAEFPAAEPAKPAPTAPAGDIADTTPDFTWPEQADARWYELDLDAGTVTWWEAAAHCGGGTCTVNPGVALAEGAHTWKVRGRNLLGMGTWSDDTDFEIWAVPGTPTPTEPEGLYVEANPMTTPSTWEPYTWSVEPAATDYDLVVMDGGGTEFMQSFDSSICGATDCAASPGQGLPADSYTWTVEARNPGATAPASAPLAFEVWDTEPDEATPTAPTGERFEPWAPLYEWLAAPGATLYNVKVRDLASDLDYSANGLGASAVCADSVCSHQGTALPDPDVYSLKVVARNGLGAAAGMLSVSFTVLECVNGAQKDLEELEPGPVTTTKTVKHCGPVTAGAMGPYEVSAGGDLTVHTRDGFSAQNDFKVLGELTIISP